MSERRIDKNDSFKRTNDGKFLCLACSKILSSKERVLQHLHLLHSYSPLKPVKKLYKYDSSVKIPRRTLMRHRWSDSVQTDGAGDALVRPEKAMEVSGLSGVELLDEVNSASGSSECCSAAVSTFQEHESSCFENSIECKTTGSFQNVNAIEHSDSESDLSDSIELSESHIDSSSSDTLSDIVVSDVETENNADGKQVNNDTELFSFGIAAYTRRYNCSKVSSEALLSLIKALNPDSEVLNDLTYKKIYAEVCHTAYKVVHYCESCLQSYPDDPDAFQCSTDRCQGLRYIGDLTQQLEKKHKPRTSFIICDIGFQLKLLLEREGVLEEVLGNKEKAKQKSSIMSDIYQGIAYKDLYENGNFLSYPYNVSGILNTDGIPLYNSSKVKLWPVFIAINELSVSHRFCRGNTLLAGIWQGNSSPPFLEYFKSVGNDLKNLYDRGLNIVSKDGEKNVKLCVCLATMDLQAKAYATGMTMHNGAYGCVTCEEPGETVRQGRGHRKSYPYRSHDQKPPLRNSDDVKYVKGPSASRTNRVKGICGPSGFISMPWFDVVNGVTPDYMHGVLMGVTKTLLYLWVSPTQSSQPYFVGKSLNVISKRLKNINPPSCIQRLPRDLEKHYNNLKATELQIWLLFYAYPCLKDILAEKYLEHFCMLSEGIYLLLGDSISEDELARAEGLLDCFYKTFSNLYGQNSCGLNVHNIGAHLVHYVRLWGPLYCWSCFGFEDNNAEVLKSVHGTGDVTYQIINNKLTDFYIRNSRIPEKMKEDPAWSSYFSKVCPDRTSTVDTCGSTKGLPDLEGKFISKQEQSYILEKIGANKTVCKVSYRTAQQGTVLHSQGYKRMKRRNCHTFLCGNGVIFTVKYFVEDTVQNEKYAVGNQIDLLEPVHPFPDVGHHLLKVKDANELDVILASELKEELFVINPSQGVGCYISRVPNLYGISVFK